MLFNFEKYFELIHHFTHAVSYYHDNIFKVHEISVPMKRILKEGKLSDNENI